jgi:hypothetical protein
LQLLSGFEKSRPDNCLAVWDFNQHGTSLSPSPMQSTGGLSSAADEYKRVDILIHQQHTWKPAFDYGVNEHCHALAWFKPGDRLFAAATTLGNTRNIRIYDPRGSYRRVRRPLFDVTLPVVCLAASPVVLTFASKASTNLCCDPSEKYLAATADVSRSTTTTTTMHTRLVHRCRKRSTCTTRARRTSRSSSAKNTNRSANSPGVEHGEHRRRPSAGNERRASPTRSSQLGYCIRESPKFHLLSVARHAHQENDVFVHRILQCKSAAVPGAHVNELALLSVKVPSNATASVSARSTGTTSTTIGSCCSAAKNTSTTSFRLGRVSCVSRRRRSRSTNVSSLGSRLSQSYSPRNGPLWTDGHAVHPSSIPQDKCQLSSRIVFNYDQSAKPFERRTGPSPSMSHSNNVLTSAVNAHASSRHVIGPFCFDSIAADAEQLRRHRHRHAIDHRTIPTLAPT